MQWGRGCSMQAEFVEAIRYEGGRTFVFHRARLPARKGRPTQYSNIRQHALNGELI